KSSEGALHCVTGVPALVAFSVSTHTSSPNGITSVFSVIPAITAYFADATLSSVGNSTMSISWIGFASATVGTNALDKIDSPNRTLVALLPFFLNENRCLTFVLLNVLIDWYFVLSFN